LISTPSLQLRILNFGSTKQVDPVDFVNCFKEEARQYEELILGSDLTNKGAYFHEIEWERVHLVVQSKLKVLSLSNMGWLNEKMVAKFLNKKICPNLESLSILGIPVMYQKGVLDSILAELPKLNRLTIGESCGRIDGNYHTFSKSAVLANGGNIQTLRVGLATSHREKELWDLFFRGFPALKKIRVFAASPDVLLNPDFWVSLKEYGRSVSKVVFDGISRVYSPEYQRFISSTKRVHLIKVLSHGTKAIDSDPKANCQVVIY